MQEVRKVILSHRCLTICEVAEAGIKKTRVMRCPLKIWACIMLQPNMCRAY